ncbi:MAG TPA: DUF1127 domain-containing protein [Dongiaceae bacterium]|nr:DUF1127 domain-containing protein [Dongiaceae bacterium]
MGTISLGRFIARPLSRLGAYGLDRLLEIWALQQERRALQALDDAMLKDIGLSRADVEGEVAKPFWRR